MYIIKEVETTKGGKSLIGSHVKAPEGEYIHNRKEDPNNYSEYRTIKKDGKLLRLGKNKSTGKWEVQAVLTRESKEQDFDFIDAVKAYVAKGGELARKFPFSLKKQNVLIKEINKSSYNGDLYRGMYVSEKQWEKLSEVLLNDGSIYDFNLPIISFTKDKHRTASYGSGGEVFIKFHLIGRCTGLDISELSIYKEEQEVLVSGKSKFKIIESDMPRYASFIITIKEV